MAINKAKRTKAIGALRKAGMSAENAVRHVRYLDLDEPFGPQIEELREDFPTLFGPDTDTDDAPDEDDRPMTRAEAIAARLRGEHVEGMTYRRKAQQRPSPHSKSVQENAAHLVRSHKETPYKGPQYIEPVRDINSGTPAPTREPNTSAQQLAARLKGN